MRRARLWKRARPRPRADRGSRDGGDSRRRAYEIRALLSGCLARVACRRCRWRGTARPARGGRRIRSSASASPRAVRAGIEREDIPARDLLLGQPGRARRQVVGMGPAPGAPRGRVEDGEISCPGGSVHGRRLATTRTFPRPRPLHVHVRALSARRAAATLYRQRCRRAPSSGQIGERATQHWNSAGRQRLGDACMSTQRICPSGRDDRCSRQRRPPQQRARTLEDPCLGIGWRGRGDAGFASASSIDTPVSSDQS